MAWYGYGNFGNYGGGIVRQEYEQERIGYGPQGLNKFLILINKSIFVCLFVDMEFMNKK